LPETLKGHEDVLGQHVGVELLGGVVGDAGKRPNGGRVGHLEQGVVKLGAVEHGLHHGVGGVAEVLDVNLVEADDGVRAVGVDILGGVGRGAATGQQEGGRTQRRATEDFHGAKNGESLREISGGRFRAG